MRKSLVVIALFLVATSALAITAASAGSMVKAEVPHGVISIAFDDNYENQYEYAYPLMLERGLVGTFYVLTNHIQDISGNPNYMSVAEIQEIQANGNEIGSHSVTHSKFPNLTDEQIRYECEASKEILQSYGLTISNFAYPDGLTNNHVDSIVSEYYRSGRTAYVEPYLMDVPTSQFRIAGFSAETADSTALSLLKGMVDQVYSSNGWAVVFFHNIKPGISEELYTTSTQDFGSFLDYIISKGVQALTVDQVLDLELTQLSMETNFGTVTPTSGSYLLGTPVNIEAFSPIAGEGERYTWLGWNGSGEGSYTGTDNPATITLNGPVNQTALWRHEFKLSISTDLGDTSPFVGEYWYEAGTVVDIQAIFPSAADGERHVFNGWLGTGNGSYSGLDDSATVTMNSQITEAASWTVEYRLTVLANFGYTTPSVGEYWYEAGTSVDIEAFAPPVGESERYIWGGWSGKGSGSYSGSDVSVVMDGAITEAASWLHQFKVSAVLSGVGSDFNGRAVVVDGTSYDNGASFWWDSGSSHSFEFRPELDVNSGKRYMWVSSSGLASQRSGSLAVSSSGILSGGYKTQYYVNVSSTYGIVGGAGWYDSGDTVYFTLDEGVIPESSDARYVFTGWNGSASGTALTSDELVVNGAASAVALWKKQFLVSFDQNGLPQGYDANVLVDGANYSLPFSVWVDEGATVQFVYPKDLPGEFGEHYVLVFSSDQSPFVVSSSMTVTARYDLQHGLAFFAMIGIPVTIILVILGVWFFRKRGPT